MKCAQSPLPRLLPVAAAVLATTASLLIQPVQASSHREAPFITTVPKVDGTDFYMFMSYEGVDDKGAGGRAGYVTLISNYQPLQAPYGGPNYFKMDPNALYEIHIDNNGDAKEDITFQFRFQNKFNNVKLPIGDKMVSIPLTQAGQVTDVASSSLNVNETFTAPSNDVERLMYGASILICLPNGLADTPSAATGTVRKMTENDSREAISSKRGTCRTSRT